MHPCTMLPPEEISGARLLACAYILSCGNLFAVTGARLFVYPSARDTAQHLTAYL